MVSFLFSCEFVPSIVWLLCWSSRAFVVLWFSWVSCMATAVITSFLALLWLYFVICMATVLFVSFLLSCDVLQYIVWLQPWSYRCCFIVIRVRILYGYSFDRIWLIVNFFRGLYGHRFDRIVLVILWFYSVYCMVPVLIVSSFCVIVILSRRLYGYWFDRIAFDLLWFSFVRCMAIVLIVSVLYYSDCIQ